jgi:hypothetical protein
LHYVPKENGKGIKPERGRVRGTNGVSKLPVLTSAQAAQRAGLADQLRLSGWSPWYCLKAAEQAL